MGTTPQGETYKADRLRAIKAATKFMGYIAKSNATNTGADVNEFIDFLVGQYEEVRKEAGDTK